jgi:hypothetical protein
MLLKLLQQRCSSTANGCCLAVCMLHSCFHVHGQLLLPVALLACLPKYVSHLATTGLLMLLTACFETDSPVVEAHADCGSHSCQQALLCPQQGVTALWDLALLNPGVKRQVGTLSLVLEGLRGPVGVPLRQLKPAG